VRGLDHWTPLHFASNSANCEVIRELLRHRGLLLDAKSTMMRTPLHLAAIKGLTDVCRLLVNGGADKNAQDEDGGTPLHYTSEFGHLQTAIFLALEGHADPLLKNKFGYTPSDIA